jgi:hypothetical protein
MIVVEPSGLICVCVTAAGAAVRAGDEANEGEGGSDGGETHGTGERGSGVEDWRVWELEMSVQNGRCNPSLYTQSMQRGH